MPKCLISSVIMFIIILVCSRYFEPNIKNTMILIAEGVLTYGICIIVFRDDLVSEIVSKFKSKLNLSKEEKWWKNFCRFVPLGDMTIAKARKEWK